MPDTTSNLGLKKPLDNESADIAVINENMDTIDTNIVTQKEVAESGAGKVLKLRTDGKAGVSITGDAATVGGKLATDFATAGHTHDYVQSVNAKKGVVTLSASDVGASPSNHTHAASAITTAEGTNVQTEIDSLQSQMMILTNDDTGVKYKLKLDNNGLYLEEV